MPKTTTPPDQSPDGFASLGLDERLISALTTLGYDVSARVLAALAPLEGTSLVRLSDGAEIDLSLRYFEAQILALSDPALAGRCSRQIAMRSGRIESEPQLQAVRA